MDELLKQLDATHAAVVRSQAVADRLWEDGRKEWPGSHNDYCNTNRAMAIATTAIKLENLMRELEAINDELAPYKD